MIYRDREDAGRQLAEALKPYKGKNVVVLALPRGGIILAAKVAKRLRVPLGAVLVRKIGHPSHPEYAIGAMVEDEAPIYKRSELESVNKNWLKKAEESARGLIAHRRELYFDEDTPQPLIRSSTVIIVDDGIATGLTMTASVKAMQSKHARRVIVATPIASSDAEQVLKKIADEVVLLQDSSEFLGAVGAHYKEFEQVKDEEVRRLLREASYELHQAVA